MSFDPTKPVNDTSMDADEMRAQLNGLKALIDNVPAGPPGRDGVDGSPGTNGADGRSIAEVLALTGAQALSFFAGERKIVRPLAMLCEAAEHVQVEQAVL